MTTETATVSAYGVSICKSFLYLATANDRLQHVETRKILSSLSRSYSETLAKAYYPDQDHTCLRQALEGGATVKIEVDHTDAAPRSVTGFRWERLPVTRNKMPYKTTRLPLTVRQHAYFAFVEALDKFSRWFPKKSSPDTYHVPTT